MEEIGQRQFSESVEDRLKIASNKPLSDIVSNNKLALFGTPQTKQRSRSKEQVASLKTNYTLVSTLFAKLGKATSTVSLNMKIRRVHFWYRPTATRIEIGPNGILNKVLTTSKYSSWDRCQGLGRGCNCALWSRPGLVEHLRSRPIPSKCFFRISPLGLKLSAE